MQRLRIGLRCGLLLSVAALGACATVEPAPAHLTQVAQPNWMQAYAIGVDDELRIHVWKNPELSSLVPVRYDGKISLPLIGDVQAAGKAPEAVAKDIAEALSTYVRNPNVTVMVTQTRSHDFLARVRVTGAVDQAASIVFRDGMTVLDAVLEAGGVTDYAAAARTQVYRQIDGKTYQLPVNLDAILERGVLDTNYALRPGDVVTVPRRIL